MTKKALFTALAEIIEVPNTGEDSYKNPYLTMAKFIFADDSGAPTSTSSPGMLQGIEFDDFDEVIKSAINMPVKMKFTGEGAANHVGAYVIGHITDMVKEKSEDDHNQLVATAVLYNEEYPDEVKYLKESYASGEAPGISYEIAYSDSLIKNGVQWLKNLITCAATFVSSPAYGKRTALLALASAKDETEFIETMKNVLSLAEKESDKENLKNKGGKNVDPELEKAQAEAEKYRTEAETKTAEIQRLSELVAEKDTEISTLNGKIETLERNNRLETRTRRFTEAGFTLEADAEKAEKKKNFWLSLTDEAFDEYLEDLINEVKKVKTSTPDVSFASRKVDSLPRLDVDSQKEIPQFRFR